MANRFRWLGKEFMKRNGLVEKTFEVVTEDGGSREMTLLLKDISSEAVEAEG